MNSSAFPDPINPSHYRQGSVECIAAIEAALGPVGFLAFLRGQVIRYTWRLGLKDAPVQEARKAQWYQNLLVIKLEDAEADALTAAPIRGEAPTDKTEQGNQNGTSASPSTYRAYGPQNRLALEFPGKPIQYDDDEHRHFVVVPLFAPTELDRAQP